MKVDVTSKDKEQKGKVNIRYNTKRKTYRVRFSPLHRDQLEVILLALEMARKEANTEYDSVALDCICLHFLTNGTG